MREVFDVPPMFDRIDAAFNVKGKPVIFCWGDAIYNPMKINLTPELKAHEGVHYSRQTNDTPKIEAWWERYLIDPEFRLAEEIPAHRAEFKHFCLHHKHREQRHHFLLHVAKKLSSPLYGGIITEANARRLIS